METTRLRAIKETRRVESLLDSLVRSLQILPEGATRLFDQELLPAPLLPVIRRAAPESDWCCWVHGSRLWFYSAEMSLARAREKGRVVLHVVSYDPDGEMIDSGWWVRGQDWERLD